MHTQTEVVEYLVKQGKPRNLAKAVVTEQYCGDDEYCYEGSEHKVVVTESDAIDAYNTYVPSMMVVTAEGIEFDGELAFDRNGDRI